MMTYNGYLIQDTSPTTQIITSPNGSQYRTRIIILATEYTIYIWRFINGRLDRTYSHSTSIGHRHNADYVASPRIALMQAHDWSARRVMALDAVGEAVA